nr:uncharacterized protein LOC117276683 [Nicotiana tomentosiformis]
MVDDNRIELVDTGTQKQLVERDTGLVEEVRMLRQHMTDMYQAWITGKTPPSPPPSFLDATLTQAPVIVSDDPPYSPDFSVYHSLPNLPSSSIIRPPTIFPKNFPPIISTIPTITPSQQPSFHRSNSELQFRPLDTQYYPPGLAHQVPDSYNHRPQNETHVENEKFTRKEERDEISRKLKGFKMPMFNLYDGHGDPVAHMRGYYSEIRSVGRKDELLMAYFSESLSGAALEWYTRQDVSKWYAWNDMAQDFVRHFSII